MKQIKSISRRLEKNLYIDNYWRYIVITKVGKESSTVDVFNVNAIDSITKSERVVENSKLLKALNSVYMERSSKMPADPIEYAFATYQMRLPRYGDMYKCIKTGNIIRVSSITDDKTILWCNYDDPMNEKPFSCPLKHFLDVRKQGGLKFLGVVFDDAWHGAEEYKARFNN